MNRHAILLQRKRGTVILTGRCWGCAWYVESMGADESSEQHIRRLFAMHMEEVNA